MTPVKAIVTIVQLQDELINVDGLSIEYGLGVRTNGNDWIVEFIGFPLVTSEEFDEEEDDLRELIIKGLKNIRFYLNRVLSNLLEEESSG